MESCHNHFKSDFTLRKHSSLRDFPPAAVHKQYNFFSPQYKKAQTQFYLDLRFRHSTLDILSYKNSKSQE